MEIQLTLPGLEEFLVGAHRVPWGGRSPRALTKGFGRFTLKAQADKSMRDSVDPAQVDLWPEWKGGPCYAGAPTLLRLP